MKKVLMTILIVMAMSATLHAVPTPVSHWTLDGNANDSGSYGNNGTIVGDPQYVEGRVGQAIQFDGDGDGVSIATPSDYLNTTFSVSFWVKIPNDVRPHGIAIGKVIHNLTTAKKGLGWNFMNDTAGTAYGENLYMLNRSTGSGRYDLVPSYYDTVRDGKWHHIAAVLDASINSAAMYVDGQLMVTGSFPASIVTDLNVTNQPLAFGFMPNGPGSWDWEGIIDDVQYFDVALTGTDVTDILAAAGGGCESLQGDANGDCEVDLDDLQQLANDWLESGLYAG